MKKPSKQWKEFEQIIGIVDIRIKRKQREDCEDEEAGG